MNILTIDFFLALSYFSVISLCPCNIYFIFFLIVHTFITLAGGVFPHSSPCHPSFFFFLGHSALKPGWMVHLSQSRGTRRHPNSIWTHCNHPVPSMSSLCVHLGEEEGVWVKTWPSPTLSSQAQPHVHGAMSLLLPNHPSPDFSQGRTCCPGCTSLPFQE